MKYEYSVPVRNISGKVVYHSKEEFHYACTRRDFIEKQEWKCEKCGKAIGKDDLVYIGWNGLLYCSFDCIKNYYVEGMD